MNTDPVQIGRYKVLGLLGQGAMGAVFLAEDPLLKRGVAIKVVRSGIGNAEVMARFQREAEISAKLNHPNVITVFDVGEVPGLGPFLAMELVEGRSLAEMIKEGPVEPTSAMAFLMQAADAIQAAHNQGIIHRDIKPGNFMATADGRLKLMDFGIARGDESRLTTTAAFLGTPAYASPESLAGRHKPDESSDRWAFSVTAFEMLTGKLPFQADSVGAVLYRVVHEAPVLPESMPPAMRACFERALSKDPAVRHPTLAAFLSELLDCLPLEDEVRAQFRTQLDSLSHGTGAYRTVIAATRKESRWKSWVIAGGTAAALLGFWFIWNRLQATRPMSIESQPQGAEVFVDGASLGRTPLPKVMVPVRGRLLRLEKQDYLPLEQGLRPGDKALSLRLVPAPFQVTVVTDPVGAEVLLDGESRGLSPVAELEVPGEGQHTLTVRLDGYQTWTTALRRRQPLPNPIHLAKRGGPPSPDAPKPTTTGKVKKFFKGIFGK
ncbi:MAG TPA: serine/threonine-protein kinase [Holophagaceae bacterium]|nr:serine/threonine-protein kinase [Holophagaceae bacterium]